MKISFILPSLWLSGGMRVVVEYANRLSERGHECTLTVPGGTVDTDMAGEVVAAVSVRQSRTVREGDVGLRQMGRLTWSLAQAVPHSDVIVSTHTSTTLAGLLAGRILRKGKLVWLYQDYREMFVGRPLEDWLVQNALRWHRLALVVSGYSQQELNRFSPGKTVLVGEGLSHSEYFRPLPKEARRRTNSQRTLLFLGDMRPRKGLFDFLEAAALAHQELGNLYLVIVSKERCPIESDVPFRFIHRPTRQELAHLYATCDLFVSASWWESFGLPPLEAMACGAPVVMADALGVHEYARPGENCLMVPARDPESLARAMVQVLTDEALEDTLRLNGPTTAARFTWDAAVERFEQALGGLFANVDETEPGSGG